MPTINGNPKMLLTTGSITVPNYTDSKVGHKAKFHHSLAAAIVEVDENGSVFVRHKQNKKNSKLGNEIFDRYSVEYYIFNNFLLFWLNHL